MGGRTAAALRLATACLAAGLLAGCTPGGEASGDGQALLRNETGEQGLRVVVRAPDGVRLEDGPLEQVYSFDTQWTDRDDQCYVASDGGFEVLQADGSVLARHDFADRPVCEREEIALQDGGELVWSD